MGPKRPHFLSFLRSNYILNFIYSYRYRAIHEYLIDKRTWKLKKQDLLITTGLSEFEDLSAAMHKLKYQLETKYQAINNRLLKGENHYLTIDKNGKVVKQR